MGRSGAIVTYRQDPTHVDEREDPTPQAFWLHQNFPNPFNSATTIAFSVRTTELLALRVYDVAGREVAVLVSETLNPGVYSYAWDGEDSRGATVASGIYVYELRSETRAARKEMVLIR